MFESVNRVLWSMTEAEAAALELLETINNERDKLRAITHQQARQLIERSKADDVPR